MKKLVGGLGAIALLTLVVSLPASAAVRSLRGLSPVLTEPVITSPAIDTTITAPIVTSPIVDRSTTERTLTADTDSPAASSITSPVVTSPTTDTTITTPIVTSPAVDTLPAAVTLPAHTDPVTSLIIPAVTSPVKADTTATEKAINTITTAPASKPVLDKKDNVLIDDATDNGSLLLDPRKQAIALLKSAPRLTIKFDHPDNEFLTSSQITCGKNLNCQDRNWYLKAFVDVNPDDPYVQKGVEAAAEWRKSLYPSDYIKPILKHVFVKPKNVTAGVSWFESVFSDPLPVLKNSDVTLLGSGYSLDSLSQFLAVDGEVLRVPYTYTDSFGEKRSSAIEVTAVSHGQKFYLQGYWKTLIDAGEDVPSNARYKYQSNEVCPTLTGPTSAKKSVKKKVVPTRLQVLYGNTPLKQTVERYKDGSCAGVYLIP